MLLVVAIIGIMSVISMPFLVHSIRGNRLRTAARTVVMSGRYARSMALLRQEGFLLMINLESASLSAGPGTIASLPTSTNGEKRLSSELSQSSFGVIPEHSAAAGEDRVPSPSGSSGQSVTINRQLEGVKIDSITVGEESPKTEGSVIIPFYSNGRCEPYSIKLTDDSGAIMHITVDPLASARTERED